MGWRSAPLSEVARPQDAAATVGLRGCRGSSPGGASLAGGDGVDGTTVSYLLKVALVKEEEEKDRRRQREVAECEARMQALHRQVSANEQLTRAESYAWRKLSGHLPSVKSERKKRRRKKLPKASSSRSSRGARAASTRKSGHSSTSLSSGFGSGVCSLVSCGYMFIRQSGCLWNFQFFFLRVR